jgi:hypothetical protein
MQLTHNTHGRGKVKSSQAIYTQPTRFELEYYYMMIALVCVDSKLQVEEKIIDR